MAAQPEGGAGKPVCTPEPGAVLVQLPPTESRGLHQVLGFPEQSLQFLCPGGTGSHVGVSAWCTAETQPCG